MADGNAGASDLSTICTIAINIAGGGLLVLPLAMHYASIVTGTVLMLVSAVVTVFTAELVVLGCELTGAASYPEALVQTICGPLPEDEAEAEAPRRRRRRYSAVVDAIVAMYSLGMLVMYVRVIVDVSVDAAMALTAHEDWYDRNRYYAFAFFVFFALACHRRLAELSTSTLLGLITVVLTALAITFEYSRFVVKHNAFAHSGVRYFSMDYTGVLALPTLTVALGYHYNAPIMYHEMEHRSPRKFAGAVKVATWFCVVLYLVVGVFGYLAAGPDVNSKKAGGNIINNYAHDDPVITAARIAFAVHLTCVFPIVAITVRDALHRLGLRLWGRHEEAEDPDVMVRAHRSLIVTEAAVVTSIAVVIAMMLPGIGRFVDIIGVVFGIFLIFIGPALMGLAVHGGVWRPKLTSSFDSAPRKTRVELACLAIVWFGVVAVIVGLMGVLGLLNPTRG
jgi:sodium-coupled neutral amino acid transporter 11